MRFIWSSSHPERLQTQKASQELYLGPTYTKHSPRVAATENQCRKLQGATEGILISGKGTAMSAWEELHLDLPAPRWLPGQWVFQSVDLAMHLTVTPVWAGITPVLSLPATEVFWQHQGSKDRPCSRRQRDNPMRCQVCFTGTVSAVKTPPAKNRLRAQSIIQGLLYQPSANLLLSWEKSKGPGQQTVC